MANVCLPIKFQVFKGNQLLKEEMLSEPIIKIGKLSSSTLRLEEETVSRMHAVIEVDGSGVPQLIDLGSTRGTTVNGARVDRATLRSGDQIQFGDSKVVVTFAAQNDNALAPPHNDNAVATPPPVEVVSSLASVAPDPVQLEEGGRAVEVRSIYRGVLTHTRHLTDASGKSSAGQAKALLAAGIASVAMAFGTFLATTISAGHEKARYERFISDGHEAKDFQWQTRSPLLDVAVFGGLALGVSLVYAGLKRRTRNGSDFVIGADAKADAPVGSDFIGTPAFSLVSASGADFMVNVTPAMSGQVVVDGRALPLAEHVHQRGPSFSLGERGTATIDCGDARFVVAATPAPKSIPVPLVAWRWSEHGYHVGTSAALLMFLLMVFSVPPDPKSLSLDLFNADVLFVPITIKPSVEKEEEIPSWLRKAGPEDPGGKGQRHQGDEGRMGNKKSKNEKGLYAIKGPKDNQEQYLAKQLAQENAKSAGILGVLRTAEGSHIASIWGRTTAVGADTENVLGGLVGSQIGEAYGVGGLGVVGSGQGGGGTGLGTLGLATFGTLGKGGGGGPNSGYGRGLGGLAGRRPRGPEIIPGQAVVRGSLDREIIRRIIRRHINEVKFCYESELTKKVNLAGRVSVQFTISATGQVLSSVLQSSTMGNVHVESCVTQAVRRWEFPRPVGGGLVIVSYPFNFQSSGAGE
jgi:TonB family protein